GPTSTQRGRVWRCGSAPGVPPVLRVVPTSVIRPRDEADTRDRSGGSVGGLGDAVRGDRAAAPGAGHQDDGRLWTIAFRNASNTRSDHQDRYRVSSASAWSAVRAD